jgi:tetratricopeptide (TPR) repeat protein
VTRAAAAVAALLLLAVWAQPSGALTREESLKVEKLKIEAVEHFNRGNYEKAVPLLNEVLAIDPEEKTAARYLMIFKRQIKEPYCKLAAEAYLSGNYPDAISNWEKVLQLDPGDMRVKVLIDETFTATEKTTEEDMFAFANMLLKEGRYEDAEAELRKVLEAFPDNQQAAVMLSSIRRTLTDTTIKRLYEQANMYLEQKEYDLAIEQWKSVLAIDKNQELASRQIARVQQQKLDDVYSRANRLYMEGDYMGSRDLYTKILADNPTDKEIRRVVSKLDQTVNVVSQLFDRGKAWDVLRRGLSHHISPTGNPKVAIAAAWYAMQIEPDNTLVLAVLDFIEREYASVIRTMEGPVKDMKIIDQYLFAALNSIYEGRYDLAIQGCRLVLELEPENVLALKRLGSAYFAMGRKDMAKQTWERALKIDPKDAELRQFVNTVR